MEKYSMFLSRKNQYCENDYTTKCNPQIQCDPYQITSDIFHRTRTKISQCIWKQKRHQIAEVVLWKKNGSGGSNLPEFRLYYKATVIKTVWYWHKNRNIDQWNKIESPEINPCAHGYLIFAKEARIYNGAKIASSINGAGKTGQLHVKESLEHFLTPSVSSVQFSHSVVSESLQPHESQHTRPPCPSPTPGVYSNPRPSTPYTKIHSKWLKYLNVRPETIKLLEENVGRTLDVINRSKILYDLPPRVMEIKTKVKKWDLIKLKSFCKTKETIIKVKRQPSEWEKIIANEATDEN